LKLKEKTALEGKGSGTFTLLGATAGDSDSGTVRFTEGTGHYGRTAEGYQYFAIHRVETLVGQRGRIVIRSNVRVFEVAVIDEDDMIATGTWSMVSGSGAYSHMRGSGGVAGILRAVRPHSEAHVYTYRYQGFATKA
jgi:hypothetical protein